MHRNDEVESYQPEINPWASRLSKPRPKSLQVDEMPSSAKAQEEKVVSPWKPKLRRVEPLLSGAPDSSSTDLNRFRAKLKSITKKNDPQASGEQQEKDASLRTLESPSVSLSSLPQKSLVAPQLTTSLTHRKRVNRNSFDKTDSEAAESGEYCKLPISCHVLVKSV